MQGHVYTIYKLSYINGIIKFLYSRGLQSFQQCVENIEHTAITGEAVEHPSTRIWNLAKFARDLGLLVIDEQKNLALTPLGGKYAAHFQSTWEVSPQQADILREHICSNVTLNRTVYTIGKLFMLVLPLESITIDQVKDVFAEAINKTGEWGHVTRAEKTKFTLHYLKELRVVTDSHGIYSLTTIGKQLASHIDIMLPLLEPGTPQPETVIFEMTDNEFENIVAKLETSGSYEMKQGLVKIRKENRKIIDALKKRYNYACQLCGEPINPCYGVRYVEAHHIEYFSLTQDSRPENIVLVCPNHHKLIHVSGARFDRVLKAFIYHNGDIGSS